MFGEDKLDPLIIGKSANPHCFRGVRHIPLPYCSNAKTSQVWTEWVNKFDHRMQMERRKVALIIDNCPTHPVVPNLTNVEVVYLPPNTTSHTQPCDQGIIQALKLKTSPDCLVKFFDSLDDEVPFRVNVLDAIIMLRAAWSEVSSTIIKNCFHHCGFSLVNEQQVATGEEEEEGEKEGENTGDDNLDTCDDNLLDRLCEVTVDSCPEDAMEDWVNCDEDTLTSSDIEIIQLAQVKDEDKETHDEQDDFLIQKPTVAEVRKALKCLQDFCLCSQVEPNVLDSIASIEKQVNSAVVLQAKQMKLTDFFHPH